MRPIPERAATLAAAILSIADNCDEAGVATMIAQTLDSHDLAVRARLGRAFGLWSGGLDGPPPSVEEIEAHAASCAKFGRVMALHGLARSLAALDRATGIAAVDAVVTVIRYARRVVE